MNNFEKTKKIFKEKLEYFKKDSFLFSATHNKITEKDLGENKIIAYKIENPYIREYIGFVILNKERNGYPYQSIQNFLENADIGLIKNVFQFINTVAKQRCIDKTGFRIIINQGDDAHQFPESAMVIFLAGGNRLGETLTNIAGEEYYQANSPHKHCSEILKGQQKNAIKIDGNKNKTQDVKESDSMLLSQYDLMEKNMKNRIVSNQKLGIFKKKATGPNEEMKSQETIELMVEYHDKHKEKEGEKKIFDTSTIDFFLNKLIENNKIDLFKKYLPLYSTYNLYIVAKEAAKNEKLDFLKAMFDKKNNYSMPDFVLINSTIEAFFAEKKENYIFLLDKIKTQKRIEDLIKAFQSELDSNIISGNIKVVEKIILELQDTFPPFTFTKELWKRVFSVEMATYLWDLGGHIGENIRKLAQNNFEELINLQKDRDNITLEKFFNNKKELMQPKN